MIRDAEDNEVSAIGVIDVIEHPHTRMVRMTEPMRPCSAGERSGLYGQSAPAAARGRPTPHRGTGRRLRHRRWTRHVSAPGDLCRGLTLAYASQYPCGFCCSAAG